jgi:predicted permease
LETLAVARGLQEVESDYSRPLWVLMTLVGLVLLIACANVANLMLARAAARQREIAVRLSLGAARRRVFRQLLTESILLALLGATAGLVVARWTMRALTPMVLVGQPDLALDVHLDLRVLAFTAAVALVTGVLFGLVPALRGTRLDVNQALKAAGSGSRNSSSSESRLTRILVSAQVALSLLLLVGAGLFVRTLIKLEAVPLGLNSRNVLLFGIDPSQNGYTGAHLLRFYERLLERVRATPAVESASIIWMPLMSGSADETTITLPAQGKQPERKLNVYGNVISPDFFRTMQIPLLAGRDFRASDAAAAPRVAIVNRLFAHAYFGSETVNAVGRHFKFDRNELTVIGVAADTPYRNLRNPPPPTVFLPFTQVDRLGWLHIAIRSALPPTTLVPMLRGAVRAIDDSVPLYDIRTQTQQIDQSLALERLFARVSSFFGILALLLAAIGIYGVLAYSVTRRINEIGIRVALGAQRHRVIGLVVRDSLVLVCSGALIGLAVTLPCTRLLSSMVFGISTTDPATLGGAIGLMLAVSGLAAFVPAHRAAQIDPMVALRYE